MQAVTAPARREVTVIPANPRLNKYTGNVEGKILNVCAYARVSTDDEEQLNSFEAQKEYYTEKIQSNPKGTVNNFSHISLGARQAGRIDCRSFKAVVVPVGLVGNAERFPSNPQAHPMLIASSVIS